MGMRIRLHGAGHASGLLAELNRCRVSSSLCDVLLLVGGRSFAAHRAVLACAASYFHGLFAGAGAGGAQGARGSSYTVDFVSAANFEKVLTFIYTAELHTDLIDVGVLYEVAERLGVRELVRACHATFPDLQGLGSGEGAKPPGASTSTATAAAALCSSSSSSSSSSSGCSSAAAVPPPPLAPSRLPDGASRQGRGQPPSLSSLSPSPTQSAPAPRPLPQPPKAEDEEGFLEYARAAAADMPLQPGAPDCRPSQTGHEPPADGLPTPAAACRGLKTEEDEAASEGAPQSLGFFVPDTYPDSSAQLGETCVPSSSSGDPLEGLRLGEPEGEEALAVGDLFFEEERLRGGAGGGVAEEIIELSDEEEHCIEEDEEEEEEEEEEDLVCLENGSAGGGGGGAGGGQSACRACKACGALLPPDATTIRAHAETHLSDSGTCRVCGATFAERSSRVTHALSHVGILLFSCDMCRLQFGSRAQLAQHRRQSSAGSAPPLPAPGQHAALTAAAQGPGGELRCAICAKAIARDFQAVRDHLLEHICIQSLRCGVCDRPHPSLCTLLWHALTHLSLPVYCCPSCSCGFLERPLLEKHLALHGGEREGEEEEAAQDAGVLHCFLCPLAFRSASAFQYHLSLHSGELLGAPARGAKRKADSLLETSSSCSSSSPLEGGGFPSCHSAGAGSGAGPGAGPLGPDGLVLGPVAGFPSGLHVLPGAPPAKAKWYRCRFCGKRFAHSGEFTYHLRIHTGEKPYQCKVCLRFFRGRSTMICHLKTHAGALMYRCTVCGLYFSTLKLVTSHMELHKDCLPPDFNIEQTFMYNDHSKEPLPCPES